MRPILSMITANLKMTVRNRQALFWNLAFPALFIILFGALLGSGGNVSITVGVAGQPSELQTKVIEAMKGSKVFKVKTGAEAAELKALSDGNRDAVLVFGPPAANGKPTTTLYYDESEGPNGEVAVSSVRQVLQAVAGGEPAVTITQKPINSTNISFIDFFVPGIIGMSLMNSGIIGLSTSFVTYRERGILRRIKVTPFPLWQFILARVLASVLISIAQALILIALGKALFGITVHGNPLVILLGIVLGALAFLAIGFAISGFSKNAETAASYANLITFPMLFLSGVFFKISDAPGWLQPITKVLPLTYSVNALRDPMTRGLGLGAIWVDLVFLAGTFVVAMVIAVRFFRWEGRAV
ncbi:MAG TPA: ABC transporter permease [Dehalococcoidia bacterium]|nr:ABC transporter permease [Dehalococcoidia bacterium]